MQLWLILPVSIDSPSCLEFAFWPNILSNFSRWEGRRKCRSKQFSAQSAALSQRDCTIEWALFLKSLSSLAWWIRSHYDNTSEDNHFLLFKGAFKGSVQIWKLSFLYFKVVSCDGCRTFFRRMVCRGTRNFACVNRSRQPMTDCRGTQFRSLR